MSGIPKPVIALAVLALAGGAVWYATRPRTEANWLGYVEAETLYVAAPVSGRLAERAVDRGSAVAAGTPLFSLAPETTDAETARLEAQVAAALLVAIDGELQRHFAIELRVPGAIDHALRTAPEFATNFKTTDFLHHASSSAVQANSGVPAAVPHRIAFWP